MTRRATFRESDLVRLTRAAQKAGAPKAEFVYPDGTRIVVHTSADSPLSTTDTASYPQGPRLKTADEVLREIEGCA